MIEDNHGQNGLAVYKAKGRVTFLEICAKVMDFSRGQSAPKVLCDLTRGTVADLTTNEIEDVIELIGQRLLGRRGGRAAIVAHSSVDCRLARMFGIFAEIAGLPVIVKTFRIPEIAREWLEESP